MNREEFIAEIAAKGKALTRYYMGTPFHIYTKWKERPLNFQFDKNNKVALINLKNINWAEYSPKYDIESFDGTTMVFVSEEYILELRLP